MSTRRPAAKRPAAASVRPVPAPAAANKTANRTAKKTAKGAAPARQAAVRPAAAFSLQPIQDAVRARLGRAGKGGQADAFAEAFYRRMDQDEFPLHSTEAWAALACDMYAFASRRKPGTARVRVFNPTLKDNGWESSHSVLQIVNDDMPFLVESVSMALAEMGVGVHVLGHPVVRFERDRAGRVSTVGEGRQESLMLLEIDRQPAERMGVIEQRIAAVLEQVRAIVRDWSAMRERMLQISEDLATRRLPVGDEARREAQEFLRWAANDHFTFFGYREYRVRRQDGQDVLVPAAEGELGLMKQRDGGIPRPVSGLAANNLNEAGSPEVLILTKTNARASVHRKGYMDYIGVLSFDADGRITGEQRFLGMFTSSAYTRRPWDIPLVRLRHDYVMRQSGLSPNSHSGKALRHILETLPREELFQSSQEELARTAMGILGLQERVRSRLFLRRDRYGRFWSALVYIPRDRFNTELRLRIEALLKEALDGETVDASVQLGESPLAQLHLVVRPRGGQAAEVDTADIERRLAHLLRNWQDDLREVLIARHGESEGLALAAGFGKALPVGYIEDVSAEAAAEDVAHLAALAGPDDLRLRLSRPVRSRQGEAGLRLNLYRQGQDVPLSDVLPLMENMGLRVIAEHPYRLQSGEQVAYIQEFEVEVVAGEVDVGARAPAFEQAFTMVWNGQAENDRCNRLVLRAGLDWRQVAVLRGYSKYLLQTGVPFSQAAVEDTLGRYPLLARLLVLLFETRFDPALGARPRKGEDRVAAVRAQLEALAGGDAGARKRVDELAQAAGRPREAQLEAVRKGLRQLLDEVSSLDDDRILRSLLGTIQATLRTSYWQRGADGQPAPTISFKLDPAKVPDLPRPRPYREIFVYGPRVEGVHLRFGAVARGGLRWSDRREDFRTEVLGLVKAQMVKNTVIVPVGAKGGFYVKRPPASGEREAVLAEGIACYRLFIQGLLDITDNIVEGRIVPPRDVVRHDGDDPYLVVAADKGTATFSDIANALALEHGFWLGDAFASGGSVGYDHKGMGITARGAWEAVKRHFREM
ncbi:MAG: NAD-glutamate dehydrogenase, partial [Pseudoxanthomonas sp.]